MSHLTDGDIHVYLDGALDLLPDHRAGEIREHLSRCEDCQSRLEEERRIRERASGILGSATAGASTSVGDASEDLPSFDTIRERAGEERGPGVVGGGGRFSDGSPERSEGPSRKAWYRGVAWAATVVLSLGLGWYARSGVVESDVRSRPVLRGPTPAVTTEAAEAAPARARQQEAPSSASGLAQQDMQEDAPSPAEPVESTEARTAALGLDQGATPVEGSLAVTGLPVVSVAWETDGAESMPTLRVVQQLPSGESLSLHYTALDEGEGPGFTDRRAAELDAVARAPVPEAEALAEQTEDRPTSVTRRYGRWLLEATAPLEPDSVRALLDRLPPR